MQNHNDDSIKTSDTVLRKNIPLTLFERVVCKRELETEQNCNILTPTLLAITAFLSRSPRLLNRGPEGPASLDAGFLYRILPLTRLIPNCNCSIGGLRAHSAGCWLSLPHLVSNSSDPQLINRGPEGYLRWVLAFSTASCLQLIEFPVHWVI